MLMQPGKQLAARMATCVGISREMLGIYKPPGRPRSYKTKVPNHAGVVRRVTNIAATIDLPASETWSRLFGGETLTLGSPYELKLADSLMVRGITRLINPRRRLVGTIPDLNNAVFVLTVHDKEDKSKIAIELSTYDVPADQVATTERQWTDALNKL